MYAKILVPVDGSPTSDHGLQEAIKLARLTGARVRLIHVVDELTYITGFDGIGAMTTDAIPLLKKHGQQILNACEEVVAASGIPVDSILLEGFAGRVCDLVVAEAKKSSADLIVLGTHGRRGLGRMFLGSDAEQIVRHAQTPVLLIRATEMEMTQSESTA